jgi:hypothetical protein
VLIIFVMKRMKLFYLLLLCMFLTAWGCNNSNTGTDSTKSDTAVTTDTTAARDSIHSNPDAMSDPH